MRRTRIPKRIRNYYVVKERGREEVPWVRTQDFASLDLPRPIVVVNGAFDVLHSGHMKIIFQARARAGTLVLALDSDQRVARKGIGRPIQTFVERLVTLNFMPVDYVVEIDQDRDMTQLFRTLRPDLRVQGWDYFGKDTKFPSIPKCYVRSGAMRTSKIIERCKNVKGS
jgi:cytidyltransferase-like protein